ncbi:protein PHYTOCHROME KINASE SUBSTRATE 2-like [Rutidosis leptorrhynchoides]|uniref:protein PHYTOCHROME KINASE SUBSTRATE 2-like n=1 Tax=Rutidosis leptorrhynchoides TaxID=125765 RepID=UPI003A98F7EB
MIASDERVTLDGNNVDIQDASFSSYLNDTTMVVKITHPPQINTKKKVEDGEIGIFGAEKYFKGAMDEQLPRTPHSIKPSTIYHPKTLHEKDEEPPKPKTGSTTPSMHSEASWNSRSGLLVNGSNRRIDRSKSRKTNSIKSLLTSLGCNCNDKASIKIAERKVHVNENIKPPTKAAFVGGFIDNNKMNMKREDCFAFPVLNTRPHVKNELVEGDDIRVKTRRNSQEGFGSPIMEKGKKSFSLERKLTMMNWDGVTPRSENIDIIGENDDVRSDTSSDLFEIESFSTNNGNNSFLARQVSNGRSSNATLTTGYAPSEASIAWSVVTASVANFSIVSDYEDTKTSKNYNMTSSNNVKSVGASGILSGCNSHKSVRVAGEHVMVSGGDRVAVTNSNGTKERARLDTMAPIMKFQAESKPMSSLPRGHSPRASHHLYIQKQ